MAAGAVFFYYDCDLHTAGSPARVYANAQPCHMIYRYFYLILGIIVRTVSVWVEIIFHKTLDKRTGPTEKLSSSFYSFVLAFVHSRAFSLVKSRIHF